ncbi:MAG: ATP-binding protein [Cytophagales bacterium]
MYFFRKNYLWVCFLFFVGVSFVLHLVKNYFSSSSDNQIFNEIKTHVSAEESVCSKEVEKVAVHILEDKPINFTNIGFSFKHPILIFKNNRLVLWSSNKIPCFPQNINRKQSFSFYNEREEKYITHSRRFKFKKDQFEVVGIIPIVKKYKIANEYLKDEYNSLLFPFKNFNGLFFEYVSNINHTNFYGLDGSFLFSLSITEKFKENYFFLEWCLLVSVSLSLVFGIIFLSHLIDQILTNKDFKFQALVWVSWIVLVRVLLMIFKYPLVVKSLKVFQNKYFAGPFYCPSLGDLLLHSIAVFLILGVLLSKLKFKPRFFKSFSFIKFFIFSLVIVVVSQFFYNFYFELIKFVNYNFEYEINVFQNIYFNTFKACTWVIFIVISAIFFIVFQFVVYLFKTLFESYPESTYKQYLPYILIVLSSFCFYFLSIFLYKCNPLVCVLGVLHFSILYYFKLYKRVKKIDYSLYVYVVFTISFTAILGSLAVSISENEKDIQQKNIYSTNLILDNDLYGEFVMNEISDKISKDLYIQNALSQNNSEQIIQKIKNVYIDRYLEKYENHIYLLDSAGNTISNQEFTEFSFFNATGNSKFKTDYRNLFFVNDKANNKKYLSKIKIENKGEIVGYVILEFYVKRIIGKSLYPRLLLDKRFAREFAFPDFSYAIYSNDTLLMSSGSFTYRALFLEKLYDAKYNNKQNIEINGYKHFMSCQQNQCIIVSSEENDFAIFIANFSFLFVIQLVIVLILILTHYIKLKLSNQVILYSTKIQIYLNLAFIVPLIFLTSVFIVITIKNYNDDLRNSFNVLASKVSSRLSDYTVNDNLNTWSENRLKSKLNELSQNFEVDINVYSTKGNVVSSSLMNVFENKIISEKINPEAYSELIEKKKKTLILNETLGDLEYNNIYTLLKSSKSGKATGIVSIPFYETMPEIEKKISAIVVSIFNLFVVVFIIFVIIIFYITKSITFPIDQLKLSMQNVSLQSENQVIVWDSKDEIGQLINEYNHMIFKLDESKALLSKTEKESAWREMAKQVAHEIKNPLTPMKLNLQYLDMIIKREEDPKKVEATTQNTIKIMLEQIETLSEIATSFSNFAKMPTPKLEKYNLTEVVQSIVDLNKNDSGANISFEYDASPCYTLGDKDLMGRIINNLIINGIQAVPSTLLPNIQVQLQTQAHELTLTVTDNGTGIPEEIQKKVFLPNFSTKYFGSGIGLAVAKQGVEFFGGDINFETSNSGTTFFIKLPKV